MQQYIDIYHNLTLHSLISRDTAACFTHLHAVRSITITLNLNCAGGKGKHNWQNTITQERQPAQRIQSTYLHQTDLSIDHLGLWCLGQNCSSKMPLSRTAWEKSLVWMAMTVQGERVWQGHTHQRVDNIYLYYFLYFPSHQSVASLNHFYIFIGNYYNYL